MGGRSETKTRRQTVWLCLSRWDMDSLQPEEDVSMGYQITESQSEGKREPMSTPPELMAVNPNTLEAYVRERIKQAFSYLQEGMLVKFPSMSTPMDTMNMMEGLANEMLSQMTPVISIDHPHQDQKYKLMFIHKCLALGCMEPKCDLCEANPRRRCRTNFAKKYFKGDILKAKCGGPIYVELVDSESERRVVARDMDVMLEMCILDGNRYDQLFSDGAAHCDAKGLELCALLTGNEGRSLLQSHDRTANKADGRVVIPLQKGVAGLPDLSVQYSSEALLSGRRPPFRLMVRILSTGTLTPSMVVPGISDGFVVASGRSRLAQKKHIPSVDDPVSRLENMGKERVKKLKDLRGTGVEVPDGVPWVILKVGDFRQLALEADKDGQLKQKMLHILKMSEKAWDETRDHALMAVTNDTRMRAWYRQTGGNVGLVYSCYLGETDMDRAVALIQDDEMFLKEHLAPAQRELVRDLQKEASECWWRPGHPGWTFYPFDSETFKQSPDLLTPPKEFRRSSQMDIKRKEASMTQYDHMDALPGRPIVSVLQAVPMSPVVQVEGKDGGARRKVNEVTESRKRMRIERGNGSSSWYPVNIGMGQSELESAAENAEGGNHKWHSPFEERDRQMSLMPMIQGGSKCVLGDLPFPLPIVPKQPPPSSFCQKPAPISSPLQRQINDINEKQEMKSRQRQRFAVFTPPNRGLTAKNTASDWEAERKEAEIKPGERRGVGFEKAPSKVKHSFKELVDSGNVEDDEGRNDMGSPRAHSHSEGGGPTSRTAVQGGVFQKFPQRSRGGELCGQSVTGSSQCGSHGQGLFGMSSSIRSLPPSCQQALNLQEKIHRLEHPSMHVGPGDSEYRAAHTEGGSVNGHSRRHHNPPSVASNLRKPSDRDVVALEGSPQTEEGCGNPNHVEGIVGNGASGDITQFQPNSNWGDTHVSLALLGGQHRNGMPYGVVLLPVSGGSYNPNGQGENNCGGVEEVAADQERVD
ncbi:hypothetical protein BSKO_04227 [Bryopsis sp. KO-2023]|nr:hypothetical protein BSKO_04227 [Bryopsis sp. KO-2023]